MPGFRAPSARVDANTGDLLLGWDTDQFMTDVYEATRMMLVILENGGLAPGGTNFDAKVRRESFEPIDLFHAHVGGMDTFARGAKVAAAIRADGVLKDFVKKRYSSYDDGLGAKIAAREATFADCEAWVEANGEPELASGRQEMLENVVNRYL